MIKQINIKTEAEEAVTRLKSKTGTPPHTLTHPLLVQTTERGGGKTKP